MNQCPISILIYPCRPYIIVTGNNSNGSYIFEGVEYNLVQALSKKINFKQNFSVYWDSYTGLVYDNGSADGAAGMILKRENDWIVGAFIYDYPHKQILSSTIPYSYDQLILALPYPRPYTSFETLFFPFTLTLWIFLSITIWMALMLIKLLQCNGNEYYDLVVGVENKSPFFNLLSVLLTGGALFEPKRSFARFLLMIWILTCLVLQTVYQGQLFNFIKMNKMAPSVRTFDELVESGFSIKLTEDSFGRLLKFDQRIEKLLKFVDPESKTEHVTETEAYVTLETQLADVTFRNNSEQIFLPKPKTIKISSSAHVMYLSKRFYLKESLDDEITYIHENGLTAKWDASYKESAILENVDRNIPRKLKISQILGMLEAWLGLLMLATILFVLEVLCPNCFSERKAG